MISIRKSSEELDRLENLSRVMADCYGLAIQASADYAVEVDAAQAALFREKMKTVGEQWRAARLAEELHSVGSGFRGELREYQRAASGSLDVLRREVRAAAAAIAAFAGGVTSHGADHEEQLNRELESLADAAQGGDLASVRLAIHDASARIRAAVEQMRAANRMAIAQLQDEIRLLHHEIDADRQRAANPAMRLHTRAEMHQQIQKALAKPGNCCLLLIAFTNWKRVMPRYSRECSRQVTSEMIRRIHAAIDPDLIVGAWSESEFLTVLHVDAATAISISREVAAALSAAYSFEDHGQPCVADLKVKAGAIDRGANEFDFQDKLAGLASALRRA